LSIFHNISIIFCGHAHESSWKRPYSDRGVRKLLARYGEQAGIKRRISPRRLHHFLLTWLKKHGIDDAFIQPILGILPGSL
jgi:integrase/recombinase XerD